MELPKRKIDKCFFVNQTGRSKGKVEKQIERANNMANDTRRDERIESCECVACFYTPECGGSAMSNRECGLCGRPIYSGSTNVDVICKQCAQENRLCKHCGGDIDMKVRRKNWPINK